MEYTVTQISPVKTQVNVNVPVEEADAALATAVALYRSKADIKGFRKGKVPASVVESRFKKEIVAEATTDLINVHINQIMGELANCRPMSRIDVQRGQPWPRTSRWSTTFSLSSTLRSSTCPTTRASRSSRKMIVVGPDADIDTGDRTPAP